MSHEPQRALDHRVVCAPGAGQQRLVVGGLGDAEIRARDDREPDARDHLQRRIHHAVRAVGEHPLLRDEDAPVQIEHDLSERRDALLREINARNLGYFKQEVDKLEAWADDLKLRLEADIRELDGQIKEAARSAAVAATLPETRSASSRPTTASSPVAASSAR